MILRRFVVFMMLLMLTLIVAAIPESIPLTVNDESREPAFICKEAISYINCDPAINPSPAGDLVSFKQYLEQVLANEWHQNADFQAFKVGVIAVRTFADREIGCGAQLPYLYYNPLWPGLVYRMLWLYTDSRGKTCQVSLFLIFIANLSQLTYIMWQIFTKT